MARAITDIRALQRAYPDAVPIARRIDELGIQWYYLDEGPVPERDKRLQVRDISELAPELEVSQYAAAYRRGDVLPPIVVTDDCVVVDGNTRTEAARRAELDSLPQFVLRIHYATAPEIQIQAMLKLAAGLNQTNGRRMPNNTVVRIVTMVARDGDDPATLAAQLNCSVDTVRGVLNMNKAKARAREMSLDTAVLSDKHWRVLGNKNAKLNNDVLAAVVRLTAAAQLTAAEMTTVCKGTERIYSDEGKLAYLKEEETANRDRIKGVTKKPTRSAHARLVLGQVLKLGEDPAGAVEMIPDLRSGHLRRLEAAIDALEKVRKAQLDLEGSVSPAPAKFSGRK